MQLTVPTSDPEAWLIAMVCLKAEAMYHERHGHDDAHDDAPDAREVSTQTRERLETVRGLKALPADARKAVELRFLRGWSYEDIAAELNVTVKYARHLVAAAVRKLR